MFKKRAWTLVASGATVALGFMGRRLLEEGWRATTGDEPPEDPHASGVTWRDALLWAAVSAVVVAATRLAARQGAEIGWERITGSSPPE